MPKNLRDFSQPALTDAVELNLQELGTLWGHALGANFHHEPEATWFVSGVPSWLFNWVTKTQLTTDTPREKVDTLLKRLGEYHLPMFWSIDTASSSELVEHIKSYGWNGGNVTVWARDVSTVDEQPLPEGVTVEHVATSESLQAWIHTFINGYGGFSETLYDHTAALLQKHGFVNPPGVHYYLGRLNGEPVTTTLLFLGGGVAGIYCTATLPHARLHGVAKAVVRTTLLDARAMGYHIATLQATSMGEHVYRSLGFKEYNDINFYVLSKVSQE
jgi:predicted GNAT family acetyltransferase